jgi:exoribonuclease R
MTYDATEPVKVFVKDHEYLLWDYVALEHKGATSVKDKLPLPIPHPLTHKWMNHDVVDLSITPPKLVFSPARTAAYLSGVLILEGNRTYGRTKNRKRLLYKCIPDDRKLPHFLVPYDIIMDFNKAHKNKYVLFKFQEWTDEHPHGQLTETLGDVNQFEAFCEYQLYSRSLNSSLKDMTQRIKEMTKQKSIDEYVQQILSNPQYQVVDLTTQPDAPPIITIDPPNTVDYDDGFSIHVCPRTNQTVITVYIAHVVFWLEIFNLWNSFDNRIATIYLPDRRRPMLPTILSESLCSLKEGTKRFALAIQFRIDPTTHTIDEDSVQIQNVYMSPSKNYAYEDAKMLYQDVNYIKLFEATVRMATHVKNSRDLVSYWMVRTNTYMAQYMIKHKTGIFRVGKFMRRDYQLPVRFQDEEDEDTLDERRNFESLDSDVRKFIEYNAKAMSMCYDPSLNLEHEVMDKKAYLRITSVIRRYEDVCNECELMRIMGIKIRDGGTLKDHYNEETCNERYRNIKRVEGESEMMKRAFMGENTVKGVLYSRKLLEDGRYEYKVYVKGEGIKEVKAREKKELYKEYTMHRYIKDRGGGLRIKLEIV